MADGDPFKRVMPGQQLAISADAYNAFIDAALAERNRKLNSTQQAEGRKRDLNVIKVQNLSGINLERGAALALREPLVNLAEDIHEFLSWPVLSANVPTEDFAGKIVILLEPLADRDVGNVAAAGVVVARVEVTDNDHKYADLATNKTHLVSAEHGPVQILWKESSQGIVWAVVRIGNSIPEEKDDAL